MAEEITKTVENVDRLFDEVVVNGERHVTARGQARLNSSGNAIPQTTPPVRDTTGQYIDAIKLNSVLHSLKDSPLSQQVVVIQQAINSLQQTINSLQQALDGISAKIPSTASSSNQLADKNFVNSSIATNTANFLGTYSTLAEIEAIPNPTNNDYAFLETADASGNNVYDRYKYSEEDNEWLFEYELNNSSFTAEQWATINSGITEVSDTIQSGDENPVSSDAVYQALQNVTVTAVDVVENGNMNAVTSNAVYEGMQAKLGAKLANSYQGMALPDGTDAGYIRTTQNGLLPYQSGGRTAGHGNIGTSSWYFASGYIQNMYVNKLNLSSTAGTENGDIWIV